MDLLAIFATTNTVIVAPILLQTRLATVMRTGASVPALEPVWKTAMTFTARLTQQQQSAQNSQHQLLQRLPLQQLIAIHFVGITKVRMAQLVNTAPTTTATAVLVMLVI